MAAGLPVIWRISDLQANDQKLRQFPWQATSRNGIAASQNYQASEVGARILRNGGNAMDAAVATAFALGVLEPWMSGLGSVGYLLVKEPGSSPRLIDFSARTPANLNVADYPIVTGESSSLFPWPRVRYDRNALGPLSVCAPTMAMGMELGWMHFGSREWSALLEPAVHLADSRLTVDWQAQLFITSAATGLATNAISAASYLSSNGVGKTVSLSTTSDNVVDMGQLSSTLQTIARLGAAETLNGAIARGIVDDVASLGGILTLQDLEASAPSIKQPALFEYQGIQLWATPENAGGVTLIETLGELAKHGQCGTDQVMLFTKLADAGIKALNTRMKEMGDCDLTVNHPSCTTSFNVVDKDGMAVSATLTLVSPFGSKVLSPTTGIMLNNAVSWFDPKPGKLNSLAAGKRCLSNMCPIILDLGNGQIICAGAAGGRKIIPAVSQIAAFLCFSDLSLAEAISLPRINYQEDGIICANRNLDPDIIAALRQQWTVNLITPAIYPHHFSILTAGLGHGQLQSGYADPFYLSSGVATA